MFSFSLLLFLFIDFYEYVNFFFRVLCETTVGSYVLLRNFAGDIDAQALKIDPLAHALHLTAVFPGSDFS